MGGGQSSNSQNMDYYNTSSEYVPVDERIMTQKEYYSLINTWRIVGASKKSVGIRIMTKLLENNAEMLSYLGNFEEHETNNYLVINRIFAKPGIAFMTEIEVAIQDMRDINLFYKNLYCIAQRYQVMTGFRPEYFWDLEEPFLECVKIALGDRYTTNIENIYNTFIKLFIRTLIEFCNDN